VFAVNTKTGQFLWDRQDHSPEAAIIAASPVAANGTLIVGVSSNEEALSEQGSYPCCTFRGRVVALNPTTGSILWRTYMVAPNIGPCTTSGPGRRVRPQRQRAVGQPRRRATNGVVYVGRKQATRPPTRPCRVNTPRSPTKTSDADCTARIRDGSTSARLTHSMLRYKLADDASAAGGSWAALNPATGAINRQTAVPWAAAGIGPTSVAGDVLFAGSTAANIDNMSAIDAADGAVLWRFAGGGSIVSSAASRTGPCPGPRDTPSCPRWGARVTTSCTRSRSEATDGRRRAGRTHFAECARAPATLRCRPKRRSPAVSRPA
jgi:outer membrane protein assembly factor BamB